MFDYAIIISGDKGNMALLEQLQVLQNKAVHIILDLPPRTSATEARDKLGWKLFSRRCDDRASCWPCLGLGARILLLHILPLLIPFPLKRVPHRLSDVSQPVYLFTLFNIYMYQATFIFWWLMN